MKGHLEVQGTYIVSVGVIQEQQLVCFVGRAECRKESGSQKRLNVHCQFWFRVSLETKAPSQNKSNQRGGETSDRISLIKYILSAECIVTFNFGDKV